MIFSSVKFLFIFLPIVWIGYFTLSHFNKIILAKLFLVLASFFFYAMGSLSFFPFFVGSVCFNFLVGKLLIKLRNENRKKWIIRFVLIIGILANVLLLGYYKYADFFISNYNFLFNKNLKLLHIALPIGISFFTFQLIAFLVDAYRDQGDIDSYSFLDYLLFITFFPQLIVGPIVHHAEVVPQFCNRENQKINWDNIAKGLFVFSIGLGKKVLLADPLTSNAQFFFDAIPAEFGALSAWWYSIEYTISYYFDLSGYADMAIGLGLLFNIKIPENFNSPYKARNFQDYWQRWHMTLSHFLSTYIFRNVYKHGSKYRNYYVAVMVTFFVSGFWHGAGWTFVAWGVINGLLVCIASWMKRKGYSFPVVLAHILTLLGIVLTRILFVSHSFSEAFLVFKNLFNFSNLAIVGDGISVFMIIRFVVAWGIVFFMPTTKELSKDFEPKMHYLVPLVLLIGLSVVFMGRSQSFLYFQF